MVKSGTAVVSSPMGTAATPGPTWVAIQSSTSVGAGGVLTSSSPGEVATDAPEGNAGEGPLLAGDPSQALEGVKGT